MLNVTHQVTYNRKAKVFIAEHDDTRIAEEATRTDAERQLIEAVEPRLAKMIDCVERRAGEAAGKRAHKGAKLVLVGAVEHAEDGKGWSVASETEEGKRYAVIQRHSQWYCGCLDWENGWRGEKFGAPFVEKNGIMCKHALAAKMFAGLEKKKKERRKSAPSDAPSDSQRETTNGQKSTTDNDITPIEERRCMTCKKKTPRHKDGRCILCGLQDDQVR